MNAAQSGHYGSSGIQNHSAGPTFPYVIVITENSRTNRGSVKVEYGNQTFYRFAYSVNRRDQFDNANKRAQQMAEELAQELKRKQLFDRVMCEC